MKLKDLKQLLNSLTEAELDQPLLYNSEEFSLSGEVASVTKAKTDLYYNGEDDPSPLYTKKQLREEFQMDKEEIEEMEVEVPKGSIVVNF